MNLKCAGLVFLTAGCLLGCKPAHETVSVSDEHVTAQDVKDQYKSAFHATKEYVGDNKDAFVAAMETKLHEMDERIDELRAKSANYKDDAKVQADQGVADLKVQRDTLGKKCDDLKQASKGAWESTKEGVQEGWDKLQSSFDKLKRKFN